MRRSETSLRSFIHPFFQQSFSGRPTPRRLGRRVNRRRSKVLRRPQHEHNALESPARKRVPPARLAKGFFKPIRKLLRQPSKWQSTAASAGVFCEFRLSRTRKFRNLATRKWIKRRRRV